MSENYAANPNNIIPSADTAHVARYLLARGFVRPNETVIDGACGYGYGSHLLSEVARIVIAIDYHKLFTPKVENIKVFQKNLEEWNKFPECDTWIGIETIEHLHDPQKFLDKVTKVTRRCMVFSSPNKHTVTEHEFHHTDVLLPNFEKYMSKYPNWQIYHTFIQGYTWIAIYLRKETIWTNLYGKP